MSLSAQRDEIYSLTQLEEIYYKFERWMDKWEFILRNDRELSRAAADIALRQLDDIILHEIQSERESIRE